MINKIIAETGVKIDIEPKAVIRILALLKHLAEGRERASRMVEHPVENDADSRRMKRRNEIFQLLVRPQSAIDLEKINRVVAVPFAFEQRIEHNRLDAKLFKPRNFRLDQPQTVPDFAEIVSRSAPQKPSG